MVDVRLRDSRRPTCILADELPVDPKHCLIDIPGLSLEEMYRRYEPCFSFRRVDQFDDFPPNYFPPWWKNPFVLETAAEKTVSVLRPEFREGGAAELVELEDLFAHAREAAWVALFLWDRERKVFLPPGGLRVGKPFALRSGNLPLFTMRVDWNKRNKLVLVPEPLMNT